MQERQSPKKAAASLIGEVSNEDFNWTVTLRNGEQADARCIIVGLEMLHDLVPDEMDTLQMLVDLHEGRITVDDLPDDVREGYAPKDTKIWDTSTRPVIENAVVRTPKGLELTDPFEDSHQTEFVLRELERRQRSIKDVLWGDTDDKGWSL